MAHRTMPGAPVELKSLSSVAKAFSLPHETPPIRLPSFPALEKTAVLTFNQTATITVTSDPNLNRGAVFRQAAYPLWMDVPDPGGYAFGYSASLKGNYADLISVGDMMYITSSQTGLPMGHTIFMVLRHLRLLPLWLGTRQLDQVCGFGCPMGCQSFVHLRWVDRRQTAKLSLSNGGPLGISSILGPTAWNSRWHKACLSCLSASLVGTDCDP